MLPVGCPSRDAPGSQVGFVGPVVCIHLINCRRPAPSIGSVEGYLGAVWRPSRMVIVRGTVGELPPLVRVAYSHDVDVSTVGIAVGWVVPIALEGYPLAVR